MWAPRAAHVYVARGDTSAYQAAPQDELVRDPSTGHWTGFFPGVVDGSTYRYYVVGTDGSAALKRDPRAVELEAGVALADCDCVVRDPRAYPWHDAGFAARVQRPGRLPVPRRRLLRRATQAGRDIRPHRTAKLLDAVQRVPYLARLGVTAVQPLPVVEFQGEWSLGYNGTDLYSPEMDYCVDPTLTSAPYLAAVNDLLHAARAPTPLKRQNSSRDRPTSSRRSSTSATLTGSRVIFDVVYNHAGGGLDPQSLDYRRPAGRPGPYNNACTSRPRAGPAGRVFAFDRADGPRVPDRQRDDVPRRVPRRRAAVRRGHGDRRARAAGRSARS